MLKNRARIFKSVAVILPIIPIIAMGLVARIKHIFGFFVYPDSYYYLLLANNLNKHGSLFGRLGPEGMAFPSVAYGSYKPLYPLFVAFTDRLVGNLEFSGHFVAIFASITSIIVVYFLLRDLFRSDLAGFFGAILLATSTNHIFWSGFIMGDSLSVFLILISFLFSLRKQPEDYGNFLDFLAGVFVSLTLLSRLTYILILPALFFTMTVEFGWKKKRLLTFAGGFLLTLSLLAVLWLPPPSKILSIASNLSTILLVLVLMLFVGIASLVAKQKQVESKIKAWLSYLARGTLFFLILLPILIFILDIILPPLLGYDFYLGLRRFTARDPLLTILYLIGLYLLLFSSQRNLGLFCAVNIAFFLTLYSQVESWESRYLVHLLPFLVIPASFALLRFTTFFVEVYKRNSKRAKASLAVIAIMFATIIFWPFLLHTVLPSTHKNLKTSYAREVARRASISLPKYSRKNIIITAMPWPYYFHLRFSTWGIDEKQPDKVLRYLPDNNQKRFLLINDLALRYHFPLVAEKAEINYKKYVITSFLVGTSYQYAYFRIPEKHEVQIYRLSKEQLSNILAPDH